jgi:hypothetical protein
MSERHQIDDFIFVFPAISKRDNLNRNKVIDVYYKEVGGETADRYIANTKKQAKKIFEQLKAYKPEPLPDNLNTFCACTGKPCDPNSWFCHRNFVAVRYLKGHPGNWDTNKNCQNLQTNNSKNIEVDKK